MICKPLYGHGGLGIKIGDRNTVESFLSRGVEAPYVVQEKVPVSQEYRYVMYQDSEGKVWRVCYEKTRPELKGDNSSPLWKLIKDEPTPIATKLATAFLKRNQLFQPIPEGQSIQMTQIGMPKKGNFENYLYSKEDMRRVANLDRFMGRFVEDLQGRIGHQLPLLCFDMASVDVTQLDKDYDFEGIKNNIKFFECQMPFSTYGYYANTDQLANVFSKFTGTLIRDVFNRK